MKTEVDIVERYDWWASLKHGGLLIAPSKLAEFYPVEVLPLPNFLIDRLRRDLVRITDGDSEYLPAFLDTIFESVLQLTGTWSKGSNVDSRWSIRGLTGEIIKPRRVWDGPNGANFAIFVDDSDRLGIGRGRRAVSRVLEWMRRRNEKIALITNGHQFRLIHAGADYDAWCEWDVALWFEHGLPGPQIKALRMLLGIDSLAPVREKGLSPLIAAIQASRKGQAELSAVLGERVRLAVEHLIKESRAVLDPLDASSSQQVSRRDIYIAATRILMRCVVILFAEARDLLPRESAIYHQSYGLQGLREQLDRIAAGRASERLRYSHGAWPRMLALFRLIYEGSAHEALPIPRYGGGLFEPGNPSSRDAILRALGALEGSQNAPSDAAIHRILELLCRSKVKVRQGRGSIWVEAPVDFSDLSSEYIGILYEGLLDFELKRARENQPMVFLNVGDQPVLPFMDLDTMTNAELSQLLDKLKKSSARNLPSDEEESVDEEDEVLDVEVENDDAPTPVEDHAQAEEEIVEPSDDPDLVRHIREMVQIWAERAVKAAKLVEYPHDDTVPVVREAFNRNVERTAKQLTARVIMPGEWFLVRWGGTRKGAGTFYTRPQLAVPTTRRTLQPLAYEMADTTHWRARTPEEILALSVCDAAVGSGSFLIAALRNLTDALLESLHTHGRLNSSPNKTIARLADGQPLDHASQESVPVPSDHPEFEERLRARLKRHVVERCLYGVDKDPLAVELARLALWIETMDPRLPFSFLDHKIRCGNALVGCWFDRFQDYPVMAWTREGGDKDFTRSVHHFREYVQARGKKKGETVRAGDVWTQRLKEIRDDVIKPEIRDWILAHQQGTFEFHWHGRSAESIHDDALQVFKELHELPVHETERRAELFDQKIRSNPAFVGLKEAFDCWCAVWFWPGDQLQHAPTPRTFGELSEASIDLVRRITDEHRFFHWELEFPDVFTGPESGFDAILGNPPWETQKPNSKEFFSNIDPLYRTYGKQQALERQQKYFRSDAGIEHDWLKYCADFKSYSAWNKRAFAPFGGNSKDESFSFSKSQKENSRLHEIWLNARSKRVTYSDTQHPFRHQGSADINTYKMFCEVIHSLLRKGGRLGLILPSGIYADRGSTQLRQLFLAQCSWEWLFVFINWNRIFADLYYRAKFAVIIVAKGTTTSVIKTSFGRSDLEDWEQATSNVLEYPRSRVEQFSPNSRSFLEIRSQRDLSILEKLYTETVLVGDMSEMGWLVEYGTEFHTTNDSKLFPPAPEWAAKGYRPDEFGNWVGPDNEVAFPVYEGRMIGQFDFSQKGWISGKGRGAVWREIPWEEKRIEPQYLMSDSVCETSAKSYLRPKIAYMRVASSVNSRSVIATYLNHVPTIDSVFFFKPLREPVVETALSLVAVFNSFVFDYVIRMRLGGLNLGQSVMTQAPVISPARFRSAAAALIPITARLCLCSPSFAAEWRMLRLQQWGWKRGWAVTDFERVRLRSILDACVSHLYGLEFEEFAWILRDCDLAKSFLRSDDNTRTLDPKGFWRVDQDKDPELRQSVLSLVAFRDLKDLGLDNFLSLNGGEGWMLPKSLRLTDFGLGQDSRAKEPQPVASRLGPQFLPWQLEQSAEESWTESASYAEKLKSLNIGNIAAVATAAVSEPHDLFGRPLETDLFGNPRLPKGKGKA